MTHIDPTEATTLLRHGVSVVKTGGLFVDANWRASGVTAQFIEDASTYHERYFDRLDALLTALLRGYGRITAMIQSSALYAAAHFLKYPDPLPGQELHWDTGIQMFPTALRWFGSPGTPSALLSLFLFGMLLALVRMRRDSLWPCIGMHAGLVTGYKIAGYCTDRVPGAEYEFLLSSNSPVLGWLAVAWLALALAVCNRFCPSSTHEQRG